MAKQYFADHTGITFLCKKYKTDESNVQYSIRLYERFGEEPFTDEQSNRVYTREEKLETIKRVLNGEVSCRQAALDKGMPSPHVVSDWVKLYKEKGEEAIQVSRGRKKYQLHADRQKYLANKEMQARLKYLEAENAYLKKAYSLIQKKAKRSKKK